MTVRRSTSENSVQRACVDPSTLSYSDMTVDSNGSLISKDAKALNRSRLGYCTTCPGVPVLLFDIKKSRLNPLWFSRQPRTVDGEVLDGRCLRCAKENDSRGSLMPSRSFEITREITDIRPESLSRRPSGDSSVESRRSWTSDRGSVVSMPSNETSRRAPPSRSYSEHIPHHHSSNLNGLATNRSMRIAPSRRIPVSRVPSTGQLRRKTSNTSLSGDDSIVSNTSQRSIPRLDFGGAALGISLHRDDSIGSAASFVSVLETVDDTTDVPSEYVVDQDMTQPALVPSFVSSDASTSTGTGSSINQECTTSPEANSFRDEEKEDDEEEVIQHLQLLVHELQDAESYDVMAEVIVNAMKTNETKEDVQVYCIKAISASCKKSSQSCGSAMVASHAHTAILRAMKSHTASLQVQEEGCNAISALCLNEPTRVILVRDGACLRLVKAITSHIGDCTVVACALVCLRILSHETEARSVLQQQKASEQITQAMQCHASNSAIVGDGCALLSNLAINVEQKKVSAVGKEIITVVVDVVRNHRANGQVLSSACFALKNFTYEETNLRSLARIKGILDTLQQVGGSCKEASLVFEKVQIARTEDFSLEEHAQESLLATVELKKSDISVVSDILDVMQNYSWSSPVLTASLKALDNVCSDSAAHKRTLCEESKLEVIMKAMCAVNDDLVATKARGLVALISAGDDTISSSPMYRMILNL